MALDPRIALAGRPGQFSLQDFATGMQQGQLLRRGQLDLREAERAQQEAEAIRQAYTQQYGGGAPAGLAGVQPFVPVQERRLGGSPTAMAAFPMEDRSAGMPLSGPVSQTMEDRSAGMPLSGPVSQTMEDRSAGMPLSGPVSQTMGLAGVQPMTPADHQGQRGFINKLYTISPKAGREAETHAYTTQKQQYEANKERVEYLGRIANGVLESPNPQQAWEVARAMLLEAGMPPGQAPEVYDPNYVRQLSAMSLDAKDKYNAGILRLQQAKEQRERTEAGAKVPNYGLGQDANAVMHEMFGAQLPPGSAPSPAMTQRVNAELVRRERDADAAKQQGRVEVAAATGREAAQEKALGQTAQKRLEDIDKAGLTAQTTHTTLDEVDRLIDEGVYGNTPGDRGFMAAYRAGTRPNDTKAQRTARLQELGSQLQLSQGSLGSGVSVYDAQVYAKAYGNFTEAKNLQEMQQSIKSMRTILNKAVKTANTTREHYEKTGKLPAFEGRGVSEQDITDTIEAGKAAGRTITRQQVIDAARSKGYDVPER